MIWNYILMFICGSAVAYVIFTVDEDCFDIFNKLLDFLWKFMCKIFEWSFIIGCSFVIWFIAWIAVTKIFPLIWHSLVGVIHV